MGQGQALRLYLVANKISLKSLAKKVGVTRPTVTKWLNQDFLDLKTYNLLQKAKIKKEDFIIVEIDKQALLDKIESLEKENKLLHKLVEALEKK